MKYILLIATFVAGVASAQEAPPCKYLKNGVDPVTGDTLVETVANINENESLRFTRKNGDFYVAWFGMWLGKVRVFGIGSGKPMYLLLGDSTRVRLYTPRLIMADNQSKSEYFPGSTVIDAAFPITLEDVRRIGMNRLLHIRIEATDGDVDIPVPERVRLKLQDAALCLLLGRP